MSGIPGSCGSFISTFLKNFQSDFYNVCIMLISYVYAISMPTFPFRCCCCFILIFAILTEVRTISINFKLFFLMAKNVKLFLSLICFSSCENHLVTFSNLIRLFAFLMYGGL